MALSLSLPLPLSLPSLPVSLSLWYMKWPCGFVDATKVEETLGEVEQAPGAVSAQTYRAIYDLIAASLDQDPAQAFARGYSRRPRTSGAAVGGNSARGAPCGCLPQARRRCVCRDSRRWQGQWVNSVVVGGWVVDT